MLYKKGKLDRNDKLFSRMQYYKKKVPSDPRDIKKLNSDQAVANLGSRIKDESPVKGQSYSFYQFLPYAIL